MKHLSHLVLVFLVIGSSGCGPEASPKDSLATQSSAQTQLSHDTNEGNWHWDQAKADALLYKANHDEDYQRSKEAGLAYAQMIYERKMHDPEFLRNPPRSEWPFPNFETGPGRPLPIHVNFYCMNDHYPEHLLCEYDVDEPNYDATKEPEWFGEALKLIRRSGPGKFPPVAWIAVIICNRAESKGVATFEEAHKVGAVFKAADIFNRSIALSSLVAHADRDSHPFRYNTSQPTPGEQQRWVIVEQHAATNHATAGASK